MTNSNTITTFTSGETWTQDVQQVFTLPAGEYYIGGFNDVMNEDIYYMIWDNYFGFTDGVYRRHNDGATFAMRGTGGDGTWADVHGNSYRNDGGFLGIVSASLCDAPDPTNKHQYYTFDEPVECDFTEECVFSFVSGNQVIRLARGEY